MLTKAWRVLAVERRLPWRFHQGGFWNVVLLRPIRRISLRAQARPKPDTRHDVTVVVAVRNRCDHRIINFLKSLRAQDYDRDLINVTVIDYDGDPRHVPTYLAHCQRFDAHYLRVENRPEWNRSHALNIGIRRADTRYLMTADVDLIFAPNYISEAVRLLREDPLQIIYGLWYTTAQGDVTAEIDIERDYDRLWRKAHKGGVNSATNLSLTSYYHRIRGYDQAIRFMWYEDNDHQERMEALGPRPRVIAPNSSYIHQWHPYMEGQKGTEFADNLEANRLYFEKMTSIVRNDENWGTTEPGAISSPSHTQVPASTRPDTPT